MKHRVLFTGHMIDAEDRPEPRFPASKEAAARMAIKHQLLQIGNEAGHQPEGFASAASGGDILFHEVCLELRIPSEIYLPLPPDEFKLESVSFAGADWERRFYQLVDKLPVYVLPASEGDPATNVYERTNAWMLKTALNKGEAHLTLLALWNGSRGKAGGTSDMVRTAQAIEADVRVIDLSTL